MEMDKETGRRRIVLLLSQALDYRNYDRFGVELFQNEGWEVEVWDITPMLFPTVWKRMEKEGKTDVLFLGHRQVFFFDQLIALYDTFQPDVLIDHAQNAEIKYKKFLKYIGETEVFILFSVIGFVPLPERTTATYVKNIVRYLLNIKSTLVNAYTVAVGKLYSRTVKLNMERIFWLTSGTHLIDNLLSQRGMYPENIIYAHNYDYDFILRSKERVDESPQDYFAFLDEDYYDHIDLVYSGMKPPVTQERYFRAIRKFLSFTEKQFGLSGKICLHPRSRYLINNRNYFSPFEVNMGKTVEMIRHCKFIVCHSSAALQLAVLYGKPIIFITTDELNANNWFGKFINNYAATFGKEPINIDADLNQIDWEDALSIHRDRYEAYIDKYVKKGGTKDEHLWKIVSDFFKKRLEVRKL